MSFANLAAVRKFGKFSVSSLSSSVVDLAAFTLLCNALRPHLPAGALILNYLINYFFVFHSRAAHGRSAGLYTVITVLKTLASALLVAGLAALLPAGTPELALKIPVDVALFFANYLLQKAFVY